MTTRILGIAATVAAFMFIGAYIETKHVAASPDEPEYQMLAAEVDSTPTVRGIETTDHVVFILEKKSGRVWKYNPGYIAYRKDGSLAGPAIPSYFDSVNVDGMRGWSSSEAKKQFLEQQKGDSR